MKACCWGHSRLCGTLRPEDAEVSRFCCARCPSDRPVTYPPRHEQEGACGARRCAGFSCPYCGECTATCPNMRCVR